MKHKRYLLFAWDCYYPRGGLDDVKATFDTLQEALDFAMHDRYCLTCYALELYDREAGDVIECKELIAMRKRLQQQERIQQLSSWTKNYCEKILEISNKD